MKSQKFNEWEGKKKINFKQTEELNEIFTEYGYGRPTKKYPLTSSNVSQNSPQKHKCILKSNINNPKISQ